MTHNIRVAKQSKFDARTVAQHWLNLGILPVPLKPGSKRPRGGKGWNNLRVVSTEVDKHFNQDDNIGGLWGAASDWIVDIDLDWEESVAAARVLFPKTFIYGRESRPRSHYLFKCTNIKSSKRMAPDGSVILEIRSSGSQSVLPPSLHPDRERYQTDEDHAFQELGRSQLERLVSKVAAASLFARYYPARGSRHDYVHAVTGSLMHDGWDDANVLEFMWAILDGVKNEDDRDQRERTIRNTIQHFKAGDRVMGFKSLTQWIPNEVKRRIQDWLKIEARLSGGQTFTTARLPEKPVEPLIADKLLRVDGLVGDIAKWSSRRSYLKQPIFDLSVGIMNVALISGNRYVVDVWDTPLQPYLMLLAPTAGGKESALDGVMSFARKVEMDPYVFQGFQSYHAMLDQLTAEPHTACWLWDEAARKIVSASRSQGGPDNQILTWLLSLYGRATTYSPAFPGRQHAIPSIDFPFFLTLAVSQPQALVQAVTTADLSSGLINRFILMDAGDEPPQDNFERRELFPARILDQCRQYDRVDVPEGEYPFKKIPLSGTQTFNAFKEFQTEARKRASFEGTNEMWGRANQNALILAGIVAVGRSPFDPEIDLELAEWAIEFCRWSFTRWTMRLSDNLVRSKTERYSKQVESAIVSCRQKADRFSRQPKLKSLMLDGYMPRTALIRLSRNLNARELDDVINMLAESELISVGEREGVEVYWPR